MAATGYTPIYLYYSSTATNQPSAGNLGYGELAINITDKNLFFKDNTNTVNTVPIRQSGTSSNGWLSSTDWNTFNGKANSFTYTANYIPYGQGTTTPTQSANLQFDGTNLGIGLTPNTSSLSTFQSSYGIFVGNAQFNGMSNAYYDGAWKYTGSGTAARYLQSGGAHSWYTAVSGTTGSNITFNQVMQTFASGGVSIGNTTDPGASSLFVSSYTFVGNFNTDPTFNRVNAVVCTSTGAVRARQTDAWNIGRADTSGTHISFYTDNGSARVGAGTISSNGSTTTYGTGSDYRMKENVQPMVNALSTVMLLNPVTYDWLPEFAGTKKKGQGFIAHELQSVVPDCVTGEKDAVDTDGNPIYQGIDTSFLVATLCKAIQELNAEVQNLKSKLEI